MGELAANFCRTDFLKSKLNETDFTMLCSRGGKRFIVAPCIFQKKGLWSMQRDVHLKKWKPKGSSSPLYYIVCWKTIIRREETAAVYGSFCLVIYVVNRGGRASTILHMQKKMTAEAALPLGPRGHQQTTSIYFMGTFNKITCGPF